MFGPSPLENRRFSALVLSVLVMACAPGQEVGAPAATPSGGQDAAPGPVPENGCSAVARLIERRALAEDETVPAALVGGAVELLRLSIESHEDVAGVMNLCVSDAPIDAYGRPQSASVGQRVALRLKLTGDTESSVWIVIPLSGDDAGSNA